MPQAPAPSNSRYFGTKRIHSSSPIPRMRMVPRSTRMLGSRPNQVRSLPRAVRVSGADPAVSGSRQRRLEVRLRPLRTLRERLRERLRQPRDRRPAIRVEAEELRRTTGASRTVLRSRSGYEEIELAVEVEENRLAVVLTLLQARTLVGLRAGGTGQRDELLQRGQALRQHDRYQQHQPAQRESDDDTQQQHPHTRSPLSRSGPLHFSLSLRLFPFLLQWETMANILTFPCGGCGRRYSVYYPKALLYELSGTGTREMGRAEDEEEERSGAIETGRRRAETAGRSRQTGFIKFPGKSERKP